MKFREHRGSLKESMETEVSLKDRNELTEHCLNVIPISFKPEELEVKLYSGPDARIGWSKTYIITLKRGGVLGFTDSMC